MTLSARTAEGLRDRLERFLAPEQVLDREIDRIAWASDASFYRLIPRAVLRPATLDEIRGIFRFARESRMSVTFRAGGTSLSGQAITDGLLVDVASRWRGIEVLDGGARVRVEPGVIGGRVNQLLRAFGRKMGPDPASIHACMMGGILSNNSSGMCCGVVHNSYHTLDSLTFVLPSGTAIDTASPNAAAIFEQTEPALARGLLALRRRILDDARLASRIRAKYRMKNTTGYSLNAFLDFSTPVEIFRNLLIGAEGTLAFIASAVLRTLPELPVRHTGILLFPTIRAACDAIVPLSAAGAAALELMDRAAIRSVELQPGVPELVRGLGPEAAGLLVELQEPAGFDARELAARAAAAAAGLTLLHPPLFTSDPAEQELLWKMRKGMFPSVGAVRKSGTTVIIEDVVFPVASLADAAVDLIALFRKHGYPEAIIFGHAKDGNLHFVLTQGFGSEREIERYARFIDEVVELVVRRYDGALKAEHGTGRNMAPFVEAEWGPEALAIMREVKRLADPDGILNPGVILDPDPRAHLRHLKDLPSVEPEVDRCIECGFCEPRCPSRDLTTTPRQRIVIRREMERLAAAGEGRERLAALERDFGYEVLDTCAADGLCATACPVSIDTGTLTKRFREARHSPRQRRVASWTVEHFATIEKLARGALRAGQLARALLGSRALAALTRPFGPAAWVEPMPRPAPPLPRGSGARPTAVYFPSCVTRTMGSLRGERSLLPLASAFVEVAARAGETLFVPEDVAGTCCGQPYSSKGYVQAHERMLARSVERAWRWSEQGRLPIVLDTTPCTHALRSSRPADESLAEKLAQLRLVDGVEFFEALLPRLPLRPVAGRAAVHPVCSLVRMGAQAKLERIAASACGEACTPARTGCCGFAGDRGWLVPELTAAAMADEAADLEALGAADHLSSSRTCEIGLTRATGRPWRSFIHLLEEATRPPV
ncbi:MAG TPA: FAD-binding and (Fe-S)-binding domain-containing protein [Thermoanaerobaculia bacterium]|nr:FAD-binding and (Fe-S)-binding domain-containing protein [Thermoanaerobaculia bacterium]